MYAHARSHYFLLKRILSMSYLLKGNAKVNSLIFLTLYLYLYDLGSQNRRFLYKNRSFCWVLRWEIHIVQYAFYDLIYKKITNDNTYNRGSNREISLVLRIIVEFTIYFLENTYNCSLKIVVK